MNTYRFSFRGRDRFIDAEHIFAAMVQFHALHAEALHDLDELLITKIA